MVAKRLTAEAVKPSSNGLGIINLTTNLLGLLAGINATKHVKNRAFIKSSGFGTEAALLPK